MAAPPFGALYVDESVRDFGDDGREKYLQKVQRQELLFPNRGGNVHIQNGLILLRIQTRHFPYKDAKKTRPLLICPLRSLLPRKSTPIYVEMLRCLSYRSKFSSRMVILSKLEGFSKKVSPGIIGSLLSGGILLESPPGQDSAYFYLALVEEERYTTYTKSPTKRFGDARSAKMYN